MATHAQSKRASRATAFVRVASQIMRSSRLVDVRPRQSLIVFQ
ncbi:hypothetical protein BURMUCF2_B0421 [Burkholderia multivorans CF2]|nr:hypothetical protein BURMUCF2_B0421 [Burkholderia multivorans CF2]